MHAEGSKPRQHEAAEDAPSKSPLRRTWPRLALVGGTFATMVILLQVFGPNGATYQEYLQLREGMSRQQVEEIIGQGDYWYHNEGEYQVASWVNKDGTYIKTVFDAKNVLVQASWESGWSAGSETESSPGSE